MTDQIQSGESAEDLVLFNTERGETFWRIDARTEKFYILRGPKIFHEASEEIRQDFIEFMREFAMARAMHVEEPKRDDRPFFKWYMSPEIKNRRNASGNDGQPTSEVRK